MVSFMKHSASVEEEEVDIVELEMDKEVTNSSRTPNNEEELVCTNDANSLNGDFADQAAADDQGETDHHGEMQNRCSQCGKKFSKANTLVWHIKSVHGPKIKCMVC